MVCSMSPIVTALHNASTNSHPVSQLAPVRVGTTVGGVRKSVERSVDDCGAAVVDKHGTPMGRLGGVRTESPVAGVGPVGVAPLPDWGKRLVAVEPPLQVEVLRRVVANKDGAEQFLGETAGRGLGTDSVSRPSSRQPVPSVAAMALSGVAAVTGPDCGGSP